MYAQGICKFIYCWYRIVVGFIVFADAELLTADYAIYSYLSQLCPKFSVFEQLFLFSSQIQLKLFLPSLVIIDMSYQPKRYIFQKLPIWSRSFFPIFRQKSWRIKALRDFIILNMWMHERYYNNIYLPLHLQSNREKNHFFWCAVCRIIFAVTIFTQAHK